MLEEEEAQFVQVPADQHVLNGENFEDQANDPMEEENDDNNIFEEDEEDCTYIFI